MTPLYPGLVSIAAAGVLDESGPADSHSSGPQKRARLLPGSKGPREVPLGVQNSIGSLNSCRWLRCYQQQ
jgi:hypothetical protein